MKTLTEKIDVSGNMVGTQFRIDSDGIAHLMEILSSLYSDPQLAVLREYTTNALDSHIQAGTSRPIEVFLPSRLSPEFVVQDYGVGMSEDDIREVYTVYGSSTKNHTDSLVGGFGIGAKSAFALGTTFSVSAVKDGIKTVVVFDRDDAGIPVFDVVHSGPTSQPNGVRVAIGITDVHRFNALVENFFLGWKQGTVLVDGTEPKSLDSKLMRIDSHRSIMNSSDFGAGYYAYQYEGIVILGTTVYRLNPSKIDYSIFLGKMPVFHVNVGDVDITPSREELKYTKKTVNYFKDLVKGFPDALKDKINDLIDNAKDEVEAINIIHEWPKLFDTYQWKGNLFSPIKPTGSQLYATVSGRMKLVQPSPALDSNLIYPKMSFGYLFVRNVPDEKIESLGGVLSDYTRNNRSYSGDSVVALPESFTGKLEWLDLDHPDSQWKTVEYDEVMEEVLKIRAARRNRSATYGSTSTVYQFAAAGSNSMDRLTVKEIKSVIKSDPSIPVYIIPSGRHVESRWLDKFHSIHLNRKMSSEAMLKRIPSAKVFDYVIENELVKKDWESIPDEALKSFILYDSYTYRSVKVPIQILRDNPQLFESTFLQQFRNIKDWKSLRQEDYDNVKHVSSVVNFVDRATHAPELEPMKLMVQEWRDKQKAFENRYPLLKNIEGLDADDHIVKYLLVVEASHGTISMETLKGLI